MAIEASDKPKRWTRQEFSTVCQSGVLDDSHVELIDGEIICTSPKSPRHVVAVKLLGDSLSKRGFLVWRESPIVFSDLTEPEPDIVIVRGDVTDYCDSHPCIDDVLAIIEVAHSSLAYDTEDKARAYARAGIEPYLVLDLTRDVAIQFGQPTSDGYETKLELQDVEILGQRFSVADWIP